MPLWFPHSTFSAYFPQWNRSFARAISFPPTRRQLPIIDDRAGKFFFHPKQTIFKWWFYALFAIISWQFVFKHTTSVNEWVILRLSPPFQTRERENTHTSSSVYYAYASSQAMSQESGEVSKNKQKKLPHGQSRTSQNIYRWDEMRCCCSQVWSLGRVVAGTPRSGCTLHALAINTLGEMMMMWCVCESIVSKLHRESLG